MPFTKVAPNKYVSPSGRHYDLAQVRLFYANGGKFPGQKTSETEPKESTSGIRKGREAEGRGLRKGR